MMRQSAEDRCQEKNNGVINGTGSTIKDQFLVILADFDDMPAHDSKPPSVVSPVPAENLPAIKCLIQRELLITGKSNGVHIKW